MTMNRRVVALPPIAALLDLSTILSYFEEYRLALTGMLVDPPTVLKGLIVAPTQQSKWPFAGFNTLKVLWGETRSQLDVIS